MVSHTHLSVGHVQTLHRQISFVLHVIPRHGSHSTQVERLANKTEGLLLMNV
jgi:hypothetical protein